MKETLLRYLSMMAVARKRYLVAALLLGVAAFSSAESLTSSISEIVDLILRREQSQQEMIDNIGSEDKSFLAHSSSI